MSIYTFPAFHPALQSHIFQSHAIYNYRHYFDDANIEMSKDNQAFELYMLIHEWIDNSHVQLLRAILTI